MDERELQARDTPREGYTTRITYRTGPEGPEPLRVEVDGEGEWKVTGQILREVQVQQLMRKHLADNPEYDIDPGVDLAAVARLVDGKTGSPIAQQLVRQVYEQAAADGENAAQAVADALGVSIATAGRRIRASKQQLGWG